ncbi:MAG: hypothetical protein M1833_003383 [Piccolia ochrophora]|nr:MAG: hypothetical protein M1833_003383 [Piccolia ochrophora]
MIDDSCKIFKNEVKAALESAFTLAREAFDETGKDVLDPNVKDLIGHLYGKDAGNLRAARKFLDAISSRVPQRETRDVIDVNDVRIFCDLSRWEHRKVFDEEFLLDTIMDSTLPEDDEDWNNCNDPNGDLDAYVTNFPLRRGQVVKESYIQFCGRYLKQVRDQDPRLVQDMTDWEKWKNMPVKVVEKLQAWRGKTKVPIDALVLFDVVTVHELSHLRTAGYTKDRSPGGLSGMLKYNSPYGWTNCVKLSGDARSCEDAENVMFLALGVRLIKNGVGIKKSGALTDANNGRGASGEGAGEGEGKGKGKDSGGPA